MAGRRITIEFLGESRDLRNAIDEVDGKSSRLSSTLGKVGKAAALGLAAGVAAGATALVGMTKNAIEDDAAQRKLAIGLKNATGATDAQVAAVEDWISAQGKALGITDDELRPAFQKLVEATGSVEEAQRQMGIAMDVSAGTGKSLKVVSDALMKANNGTTASLSKLGLKTKDAEGNTLSLEQALGKMSQTFEGQAAAKADTLEGKMGRLQLIFDETKETIGAQLIPVLTRAGDWILGTGVPAVEAFVQQWKDGVGTGGQVASAFDTIRDAAAGAIGFLVEHKNVAVGLAAAFVAFKAVQLAVAAGTAIHATVVAVVSAATTTWTAVQWLLNAALTANPIGLVIVAIAALAAGIVIAWKKSETFREIVVGALNAVKSAAQAVGNFFSDKIPAFFHDAFTAAKNKVTGIGGAIVDWVKELPEKLFGVQVQMVAKVAQLFKDAMDAGKEKVTGIGGDILEWIKGIPAKLLEKLQSFKDAGADLIGAFVDGMKNAAGVIEGIASNVWNAVRGLLNAAIDKINAALEFTISIPGPDIHVDLPDIPHLAKGGLVTKPTLALIGEDGPEAVVPLSRKNAPGGAMPGVGGGGITVVINGPIDPMGTVAALDKYFTQYLRSGQTLQFTAG